MSDPSSSPTPSPVKPVLAVLAGLLTVGVVIGLVVLLVNLAGGDDDSAAADPLPSPQASATEHQSGSPLPADVLSEAGWADLLQAIEQETGQAKAFDVTLYPTYASAQLPVDRETQRMSYYHWDGAKLEASDSFGKSTDQRVDLDGINFPRALKLLQRVRTIVEEPTSSYLIIRGKDESDGAVIYAYANNKFSEGAYIAADENGKVIRRTTW